MTPQPNRFIPCLEQLEARNLLDAASLAPMPAPWVQVFHGDFNGDGKQDVAGIDSSGQWWVSLSTGTSFTPRTKWAQWSVPGSWSKLFVADVNGDGKDDIVGFGTNGDWFVGLSNGTDTFTTGAAWAHWSLSASWDQVFVGDFNGDHKADIAGIGNNGNWFVGLSNGTGTFSTGAAWAHWSPGSTWSQFLIGDFNGDGKKDVAGLGNNGDWFVGLSNGADTFTTGAAWAHWSTGVSWTQVFVGDFNGDKKDDIAGFGFNGLWFVGLSDGAGHFVTGASWYQWPVDAVFSWTQAFIADVNGDGKSDIVGFGNIPLNGLWTAGLSDGASFGSPQNLIAGAYWSVPRSWSQVMVADFTGDGNADIAGFSPINNDNLPNTPAWNVGQAYLSPPNGANWAPVPGGFGSWEWATW
jgi:hypothetical protein